MTPSAHIINRSTEVQNVVDNLGRRISLRRLTALDKLRLFKAAGADLAQNYPWLGMALLAIAVTAIDDIPIPMPTTEAQIEAVIVRLGDDGLTAVGEVLQAVSTVSDEELAQNAGNSLGTTP